ncbi:MAG: adenosylcobinamide-GDP ribazoletransferase [Nocardioidaceae bacterium]|nr:adenosylcobinamide-GDP ribazoletransferase [Nocardioidaceae bacterium]
MKRWRDGWRLAIGTLTVLPVRPLEELDRETGRRAMQLAPVVAVGLAAPAALLIDVADDSYAPLLIAVLVVAALAASTRALHLDGLADAADGLGSGRPAPEALAVMRRGDLGPFGAVTLVLVLLIQMAALAQAIALGRGIGVLVVALPLSRLALPVGCHRRIPAARPDGLGRAVAASESTPDVLLAAVVPLSVAACAVAWLDVPVAQTVAAYVVAGVVLAVALRRVRHRLGGITGDVLGALTELTFTAALLALAVP